jgi:ABC-type branched-subunit amino acid transport system substrate-binding protein
MAGGRFVWCLSFVWFLLVACIASAQEPEPGVTDSTIRIGAICTLSGAASSQGRNLMEGLQTFFNHVNDTGGIHERRVVLIVEDDGGDPDQGVAAAQRMLEEEAVFAIACTSGVGGTRALLNREVLSDHIPALAGAALSRSLFSGFRRNVFFFGMPYEDQITLAIEYLLKRNPGVNPQMGLLSQDGFLGEEVRDGFHRVCGHYGLQIVGEERYGRETYDFSPFVNRLWSAQADHVVLGTTTGEAMQIMKEASTLGWFPQFIGPSSTAEPEILVKAEEGAENYLVVDYLAKSWEREPGVTLMVGQTQKYFPRKGPRGLHRHHVLGYVSGLLFAKALEGVGREVTRDAFIHAFEGIENLDTHGLTGVISYRSDSRVSDSRARVFQFDRMSGGFLPLTGWRQPMIKALQ